MVIPSASSEGTRSEASVSRSSSSGVPSPIDAKSRRDLDVMKSCHDVSGVMDLNVLRRKSRMSSNKCAPTIGAECSQSEVEVIHVETTTKRLVGSSTPDQEAASRPGKRIKVAVGKHKSRHGEGSSRRAAQEKESEASAEGSSPTY
ncbi:hypothetical protein GW17_00061531 [Ensete ventricosum]|nr:hypothetical protein GW17_00061531 [Ensete ventricosum]